MEFALQFGYGMMEHCKVLIRSWNGGKVILSPRDLTDDQMRRFSRDIRSLGGDIFLDPQFYLPHADHQRLCSHAYWPNQYESFGFWNGSDLDKLVTDLQTLNDDLSTNSFILPGLYAASIDDDWLSRQSAVINTWSRLTNGSIPGIATVALSSNVMTDSSQVHKLLDAARDWSVNGIYLICEHPQGSYLVEDPNWLFNVLDLISGFRLRGKTVILGYANHQLLIAASASTSIMASGTWMNVRSFPPDKFRSQYEEEMRQRAIWYYCPQALSEYKLPFLDIAHRQGILQYMAPSSDLQSPYADNLFSGSQPTAVGFDERSAFRHYLQCLRSQVINARKATFQETIATHSHFLDNAESTLRTLHATGVRGQLRDFINVVDINRAVLSILDTNCGPTLRRRWPSL